MSSLRSRARSVPGRAYGVEVLSARSISIRRQHERCESSAVLTCALTPASPPKILDIESLSFRARASILWRDFHLLLLHDALVGRAVFDKHRD